MASQEFCNLFNLIEEGHPQYGRWRQFIFGLHWEVLNNTARLLEALQMNPNSVNLSGFTDYVIANGFGGDHAIAQQGQDENSEGNDGSGPCNVNLEDVVSSDDNANFIFEDLNDNPANKKQVNRRHESSSDSGSNRSSTGVVSSSGKEDENDQPDNLTKDSSDKNHGKSNMKKEPKDDHKDASKKELVSSSSDTEYITVPNIKLKEKQLYSSSESEYEPPKKKQAKRRSFFKTRNSRQVEEHTDSDRTSTPRYQTARKSVHKSSTASGKRTKRQGNRVKCSSPSLQSPQSKEMRRLRREIQLDTAKWICPNCKKDDFVSKYTRNRHFQTCSETTPTKYKCPVKGCGATFNWSHDLKNHRNEHSENPKVFTCPYCHQKFLLQKKRIHHIQKYHPKSFMKHFGEARTESSSED